MSKKLSQLIFKAKQSSRGLSMFNFVMKRAIPFNKPHKLQVVHFGDNEVKVKIPYRKSNMNHLKGTHACGLATVGEYTAGLLLLSRLESTNYRLIMKSLHAEYHYQAKMDAIATYSLDETELQSKIIQPLEGQDAIFHTCKTEIHDTQSNHLATITTEWQIKNWSKVRTKVV